MAETLPEVTALKQSLLNKFNESASEWNSRKHDAPSPDNDEDYWWECKAIWSMCLDAVRVIEKSEAAGTLEEYSARLRNTFADHRWGLMENWGSGPQRAAKQFVTRLLDTGITNAGKVPVAPIPQTVPDVSDSEAEKRVQELIDLMVRKRKEAKESGELKRMGLE
jgi:hypothetical protein